MQYQEKKEINITCIKMLFSNENLQNDILTPRL